MVIGIIDEIEKFDQKYFYNQQTPNEPTVQILQIRPENPPNPRTIPRDPIKRNLASLQKYHFSLSIDEYYNTFKPGIYNCIVCGIPLFSSEQKFDSGCGWPAFFDELKGANIRKIKDVSHGMVRTEVRCGSCDAHLGHVFDDGPKDKTGIRYCINSASIDLKAK